MQLAEVTGADAVAGEVPVGFELADDPVGGAFGYAGIVGYLAQPRARLAGMTNNTGASPATVEAALKAAATPTRTPSKQAGRAITRLWVGGF